MKYRWDKKYLYWGVTAFLVIAASILVYYFVTNYSSLTGIVGFVISLLSPFIFGFVLAYLLNPIMQFLEKWVFGKLFPKSKRKTIRGISLTVTMLFFILLVVGLVFLIIPQLILSLTNIISQRDIYVENLHGFVLSFVSGNEDMTNNVNLWFDDINKNVLNTIVETVLPRFSEIISGVTTGVMNVVNFLLNFFIGIIVAIYLLFSKEKFSAQVKKTLCALLPIKLANKLIRVSVMSDKTFGGFIKGKLIDSFIIGVICFIVMLLLGMPYALLISVIIFAFNNIPFFGPIIGAVPSTLLILMVDPWKALWFVVFIIILQQFDGNILGPKILGDSTGLSSFWVIFSIMVFGGLFGFVGMVIGVPLFSVIYTLISEKIAKNLKEKKLPQETEAFSKLEEIDPNLNKPVYIGGKGEDADMKIISDLPIEPLPQDDKNKK